MTDDEISRAMKLKKHLNRKSKDGKEFFRYDITINPELVKELGWKDGEDLKATTRKDKMIIEKE